MKNEKIRRYKKTELLELLIRLRTENDALRAELAECRKQLEDKTIVIENSGSIAEAAMKLSGIFEAAQAACAQYAENLGGGAASADREAPAEEARQDEADGLFDSLLEQRTGHAEQEAR